MKHYSPSALKFAALLAPLALAAAQAKQITITLAGYSNDTPIVQTLLKRYVNGKIPGVTVKWEPITGNFTQFITNALAAGTAPDIFYLDTFIAKPLVQSGQILPLNGFFAKDHFHEGSFLTPLIHAFTFHGKLYGVPKDFNSLVTFYNKDMFKAAKVPYPNAKDTWASYEAKIAKVNAYLQKISHEAHGMVISNDSARFMEFAIADGGKFFSSPTSANSVTAAPWVRATRFFASFQKRGLSVQPPQISQGWAGAAFAKNLAAAVWEGGWMIGYLAQNNPTLQYGTAPLPLAPNGKRSNFLFTVAYAIAKDSHHPNTAFKVIQLLTSLPSESYILNAGLAIPSRKALQNDPYFKEKNQAARATLAVFDATKGAVPYRFADLGGKYVSAMNDVLTEVMGGKMSAKAALQQAAKTIDAALQP
jgi:multiple sugar transport system substrate-binding protein